MGPRRSALQSQLPRARTHYVQVSADRFPAAGYWVSRPSRWPAVVAVPPPDQPSDGGGAGGGCSGREPSLQDQPSPAHLERLG